MKGVSRALDRHSKLLHGERLTSFDKRLKEPYPALVLDFELWTTASAFRRSTRTRPQIGRVYCQKDRILRIDNISTLGMSLGDAVGRITGERGTDVGAFD